MWDCTTEAEASADRYFTHGVFPGDFDSDGFEDIAISGYGGVQLLKNMGDGTFIEIDLLDDESGNDWSSSLAWADINRDGLLDLYVANYVDWSWATHPICPGQGDVVREVCAPREFAPLQDRLLMNNGEDLVQAPRETLPLEGGGKGLGVVIVDLNQDRQVDVYVANDTTDNFLYLSSKQGFVENAVLAGVSGDDAGVSNGSMGIAVLDANGDSLPDLFVSNFERELSALYRNEGSGFFSYISRSAGFASYKAGFVGFGTVSVDFDFDGDQDLVVANGHVSYASPHAPYRQLALLFENRDGKFRRVSEGGYFATPRTGRGLAAGDLDNDGAVDLAFSNLEDNVAIVRAAQKPPNWIRLRLIGTTSNRPAVGAVVRVEAAGKNMTHFVCGGGSYLSHSDRRITFHLPQDASTAHVVVDWPESESESFLVQRRVESVLVEGTGRRPDGESQP